MFYSIRRACRDRWEKWDGKDPLMKLIIGLHKPTGGSILVGGVDVRNIDKAKLHQHDQFHQSENNAFERYDLQQHRVWKWSQ